MKIRTLLFNNIAIALIAACISAGCTADRFPADEPPAGNNDIQVGFYLGDEATRTSINDEATGFTWDLGDKIAVWARSSSQAYTLDNQAFNLFMRGFEEGRAYFTSTLASPMPQGTYSYYIAYPLPASVSGTAATFNLPAVQDGKASGGVDITLSGETVYSELKPAEDMEHSLSPVPANLHHLLHFFRFYIPKGDNLLGEPIRRIVLTMPQPITGTVNVDVTDPSGATLSNGGKTLTLELSSPLEESVSSRQYAVAGIFPPSAEYGADDQMQITLYSKSKYSELRPISLSGRSFEAGHVTGVKLSPTSIKDIFELEFKLGSNNLGQDPCKVTLNLPEGTLWPETSSNSFSYTAKDGAIGTGGSFSFTTFDQNALKSLSGKTVDVIYESEDAIVSQAVVIPEVGQSTHSSVQLDVPYLFYEDFSGIEEDFHSYDEHKTSNPGSRDGYLFLGDWSGARVGGQKGTSIRIAAHRESIANYPARCDSPFLTGLKLTSDGFSEEGKSITLRVRYNYSMGRQEGGIGSAKAGMYMYFGYSTKAGAIKSGDDHGTFGDATSINETDGTFTNIYHEADETISGMGSDRRLSWKNDCTFSLQGNNSTCWMYIDNIRVSIASNR